MTNYGWDFIVAGLILIGLSMLAKFTDIVKRLRVRWDALAAALIGALPILLDQLGVIDLKPLLSHVMPEEYVSIVVGLMPFVLAVVRPLVHVKPAEEAE